MVRLDVSVLSDRWARFPTASFAADVRYAQRVAHASNKLGHGIRA